MNTDADANTLGYVGKKPGSKGPTGRDSNAWFTPTKYTDMVREVMGEIDLDPFSEESANTRVKAARYFDINDDAHEQVWFETSGKVFMNPPYGRGVMAKAVDTFLDNYSNGMISEAIVLVNSSTDTKWFQNLQEAATVICFTRGRIAFENVDGKHISGNTKGQAFIYFGKNVSLFHEVFERIGVTFDSRTSSKKKAA